MDELPGAASHAVGDCDEEEKQKRHKNQAHIRDLMIQLTYLIDQLERLPSRIARKSEEVEIERAKYELKVAKLDALKAKRALEIKAKNPNFSATELKYHAMNDIQVFKKQMELIDQEAIYRKKEVERKELDDTFVAYRKIAEIKIREIRTLEGGSYGNSKDR